MEPILLQEFEAIKRDLITRHDELGMRASGQWARSLQVTATETRAILSGLAYTQQLATGREPGKFPPIAAIEKWIVDKGIAAQVEPNLSISSLAFLIARKIAREGTEYFKQGGTDLIDSVITPQRIQGIIDKVGIFFIDEFKTEINGVLQELAAA